MSRRELGPIPVSGAWTPNDPVAFRKFAHLGPLRLENGSFLPEVTLAYETLGTLNEDRSNAILVLHALTGDAHISGPTAPGQSTAGWWEEAVGPGKPLDPERYFIVVPNVLGGCQGSTGPSSAAPDGQPWGSRFPIISTRDQVLAEARLADYLGDPDVECGRGCLPGRAPRSGVGRHLPAALRAIDRCRLGSVHECRAGCMGTHADSCS